MLWLNILPDANVIIHLKKLDRLDILIKVKSNFNVILSEKVFQEVTRDQGLKSWFKHHDFFERKEGNLIRFQRCKTLNRIGNGESDIITIINECTKNKREEYLMICEDRLASATATQEGIIYNNFCQFLKRLLNCNTVTEQEYKDIVSKLFELNRICLERKKYCIDLLKDSHPLL